MTRFRVTFILLLGCAITAGIATRAGIDTPGGSVLADLAIELLGIVLTVAVVDWFFEQRRHRERGRELARDLLTSIEHAAWVWQGGPRHPDSDELLALLSGVTAASPLALDTARLLGNLGSRARRLRRSSDRVTGTVKGLDEVLDELGRLGVRGDPESLPSPDKIGGILKRSVLQLALVLGETDEALPTALVRDRDDAVAEQRRRYVLSQAHFVGDADLSGSLLALPPAVEVDS